MGNKPEEQQYISALSYAASIFNERMGTEFSEENLVLKCFQTENRQEVFEQFCKQYFPYRLTDRYMEDGYFDFHASSFIGKDKNAKDGILLRTDVEREPFELNHILLHELSHIFCAHEEMDGQDFFDTYCMDDTISREEDGAINAGYAVWREMIAELIAFEVDDSCDVVPLRQKKSSLIQCMDSIDLQDGKLAVSTILTAVMTSAELEGTRDWDTAKAALEKLKLFDEPAYMELFKIAFCQLRTRGIEIDRDFIHEIGVLYLYILSTVELKRFNEDLMKQVGKDVQNEI